MRPSASSCARARRWPWPTSMPPAASTARSSSCRSATMPAIPSRPPRSPTRWRRTRSCSWPATTARAARSRPRHLQGSKILQITPASTNIKLTDDAAAKGNTTVFRTCGRDDVQGATVGAYILKNKKTAKVAILHDKSPYGKGVADETKKALNKGGLKRGDVRVLQRHRQGLHRADQQDEAGQDRHHRARRLPHRRCAADQAVARAGLRRRRWSASTRSRTPSSASWAVRPPTAC